MLSCTHTGWTGSCRSYLSIESDFLCVLYSGGGGGRGGGLGGLEWQEEIRHWEVVENDTAPNCATSFPKRKGEEIRRIHKSQSFFSVSLSRSLFFFFFFALACCVCVPWTFDYELDIDFYV